VRKVFLAVPLALALPFTVGGAAQSSQHGVNISNRVPRSGVVSVDPLGSGANAVAASLNARGNVPPPRIAGTSGCSDRGRDVRVNQDCTNQTGTVDAAIIAPGRGQAQNEPSIAVNPKNGKNLVVGENNYQRGDGNCFAQFSLDGGRHWGDRSIPISFTPGGSAPRHYWEASGDMSVAFDSTGEAYALCMAFDRGATSEANMNQSAFFLFRSHDGGASWSFPGDLVSGSVTGARFLDKPYMTVDTNPNSPYRDRIYVSWTEFSALGSPIFFSYSADHGRTWHTDKTINVANDRDICPVQFAQNSGPGACDSNQFSEPFVAPNGDVFVVFDNYNNCAGSLRKFGFKCPGPAGDNHNQVLLFKSTNGGKSFVGPTRVADYYDSPDCLTYTGENAFRGCFPTAPLSKRSIFRAANYPTGVALKDGVIVVDFGSYINPHSNPARGNCTPNGLSTTTFINLFKGVGKVNGCNNDILLSVSNDGGRTFTGAKTSPAQLATRSVERAGGQLADQFFQWTDDVPGPVGVCSSFNDRMYDSDQRVGSFDVSLVCDNNAAIRVTDESSPPFNEFPSPSGYGLFLGDYSGLAVGPDGVAHPVWADTRNPVYTFNNTGDVRKPVFAGHGADIYTANISAP
jgi:hypothetical protein